VCALARYQLHRRAGGSRQLCTLARTQFDAVHLRTDRDVAQRQAVADRDRRRLGRDDPVARLLALGREHVGPLAVGILQQRQVRGAVRVVLERST
jgi:hypothetical protein